MKKNNLIGLGKLFFFFCLTISLGMSILQSCNKDTDDSEPVSHVDLSGSYDGILTSGNNQDNLQLDISKSADRTYIASAFGSNIAKLYVTGTKFKGTPLDSAEFKSLSGSLSGKSLSFSGVDLDDESFSYSGTKITGGGGGTSITVDGTTYDLVPGSITCDSSAMVAAYMRPGSSTDVVYIIISFEDQITTGTFSMTLGAPSATEVNANLQYLSVLSNYVASSGSVTVSESGGKYSLSYDKINFDHDGVSNVTPVVVKGTLTCN